MVRFVTRSTRLLAAGLIATSAAAQSPEPVGAPAMRGPDVVDEMSTAHLREHTTDPRFLTEWVDYVPQSQTVPSPRDFLGHVIGTPDQLTSPDRINEYFRALAEASGRVQVFSMGDSHGGREMIVAAIADEDVLAQLNDIRAANRRLADPRSTVREDAVTIAASTPITYWITAGLHSPETGPPEMVMELAYRLAVSDQPHIKSIRANVLTLISPVLEMDGRARMVDWHSRYLRDVTDLEDSPPSMAPYWGDYTAHDNNRDGLQVSQSLTRNYVRTYHEFLPIVSLDLHESVPLLYVSMGTGPYNDSIDPITVTEWQWMSTSDVSQATKLGLRGVWTWGFYTGWYPGYLLWVTNNHNAVGRFYETFGNSNPGTFTRDLKHSELADRRVNSRQWYRPWPPEKELSWSLRNNTNYMQTGVLASLDLAARNRDTLLLNYWHKGVNSIERGRNEEPFAFLIPAVQRDRGNLRHLLWLLRQHRIEVRRAMYDADLTGDVSVHAGDLLVRTDQPYGNFARTLLARQQFPKSADHAPYDDVAWSLDLMLGVEVIAVADPTVQTLDAELLTEVPDLPGTAAPGERWIIQHDARTNIAGLRWAMADVSVRALAKAWNGHGAGSLMVENLDAGAAAKLAETFHVDFIALEGAPAVETVDVDLPRVGLYHSWRYTQDSGWARYSLEQLDIPFELINKDDLRAGGLDQRFDVIVVPDQGWLSLADLVQGIDRKWGPMPYTKTEEFPSHGVIDSSDDISGGMGFEGLAHLQQFVEGGGLLITICSAGRLVSDSGIARPVRSHDAGSTPGSHITTKVLRPEHPVTWGFEPVTYVFRGNEPSFTVAERDQGMVVMQYGTETMREAERDADREADIPVDDDAGAGATSQPDDDSAAPPPLCLSGVVKEPDKLERAPAVLDVPVGDGRVLLFTFNPMHRYQNHHDIPFFTNALLFHNDFPDTPTEQEMREREDATR